MPTPKTFRAVGTPRPQGSKSVFNGRLVESSKGLKPWRKVVTIAASEATRDCEQFTAVHVEAIFGFERPKSHYRTGRYSHLLKPSAPEHHNQTPDVDKLQRALFDGISDSGAWKDDCVVVHVDACKVWIGKGSNAPEGAYVTITQIGDTK